MQRQVDLCEFLASQDYKARPDLKNSKQTKTPLPKFSYEKTEAGEDHDLLKDPKLIVSLDTSSELSPFLVLH